MEAEPTRPADGERSGRQEQQHVTAETSLGSCPPQQPQQPANPRPVHRALGRLQNRQPRRTDLLLRLQQQQAVAWQHSDTTGPSGGSFLSTASSSTSPLPSTSSTRGDHGQGVPSHTSQEGLEGVSSPKKGEKKPQKPGKYVCTFCGRPCAKPSVLQKHIRSHTGERPYPCAPCGFSFKTKSNLYKHRKSHAHRIKAGLASSRDEPSFSGPEGSGVGEDPEEHTEGESTESEEETGQHRKSSSKEMLGQQRRGGKERQGGSEEPQRPEDSQAVKQRLALRLSERKRGPMASPDDPPSSLSTSSSSLGPGSKGSTESGYFSGSGSTDLSQVSPPSSSAKTYAEIILGKYGRLGGQQRSPHQQQPHSSHSSSSGTEEKSIPFAVPKTQVIEHITKLITINEAVVDTSEIDSVKPRRSSLSRKSSMESPKFTAPKDPYTFDPKGEVAGPSGLRHLQNPEADPSGTQELSAVPLLRSHSMPSSTSQGEPITSGTMSPRGYRLCQSFDEQQAVVAEMRVGHAQRMLRRQPAIEVPLGAELMLEEASPTSSSSSSARGTEPARQPQQQQQQKSLSLFECAACGARFQYSEGYEAHRGICQGHEQESGVASKTCREDRPLMMHYKFRALAMAVRKRRKEESLEEDPPSPGPVAMSGSSAGLIPGLNRPEHSQTLSGVSLQTEPNQQQQDRKGVSVIQHTSSFEKQESISMESQGPDLRESQQTQQPEPKPSPSTSRLIRQPNIQVPEILVTVEPDADMPSVSPPVTASSSKEAEKVEEFHWPQRSQTLAQLPAEKLPPKKKRLRLAEAAQSSGESSFESLSLPRSPSQESNISSVSVSFEDTARSEPVVWASSSQSSQMLMVPSASHQHHQSHKEMRRSASEQAPASPQQSEQISENRSKSFDYGSLSPQQPATSWKERRKCLLVKHATLGEPEQEVGVRESRAESPKPGPSHSTYPPLYPSEVSAQFSPEATGKALQLLQPQIFPSSQDVLPLQPRSQQVFPLAPLSQLFPATTAISEVLSSHVIHRAFLHSHTGSPPIQIHPAQIHMTERLGIPLHQLPPLVPLQFSSRTRGSQTLYLPGPPRLTTHIPALRTTESIPPLSSMSSTHQSLVTISYHHPRPVIATCLAQLSPVVSLVVPVRLQTHIPTYASAMYTTLSQILASTRSQEPASCTAMVIMGQVERDKLQRTYLKVPSPDIKSLLPLTLPTELASGSGEGYGPLGAGGSKRMLSPAASLELSTEAQRHQKRVKEEEEGERHKEGEEEEEEEEEEDAESRLGQEEEEGKTAGKKLEEGDKKQPDRVEVTTVKVEEEQDQVPRKTNRDAKEEEEKEPIEKTSQKKEEVPAVAERIDRPSTPSYPSLHTSTTVNWCYRQYVKPNPSAQRDPRASVYSTWSVSAHNPNLPGVSTKVALSLLCSKQKHSAETYTMAMASSPAKGKLAPATSRTPRVSEVHATPPSTLPEVTEQPQHEKEETKETREEEGPSTSKQAEPSRVRIFEGGYKSNEDYVYVRGRGRGKYICGECGIRCKKPSMLKKHIRTHTDVRPYICKHCNFAFKTKGNLTKHMKSKAHGKKCQAMGVSESSLDEPESEETVGSDERVCGSEEQEEHQFSDVEESDDDDDDEEEEEEEESHEDPPSSCSSDTHPSTGGRSSGSRHSQQGTPDPDPSGLSPGQEPSPRGVWPGRRAASQRAATTMRPLLLGVLGCSLVLSVQALYSSSDDVVELTPSNFNREVIQSDSLWLVEFYAPWCGHCQSLAPEWKKAATALKGIVKIGAVDADQHKSLGGQYGVRGFPTIKIFGGNKNKPDEYQGGRSSQAIVDGAMNALRTLVKDRLSGKSGGSGYKQSGGGSSGGSKKDVVELTDDNFDKMVLESDDVWLVEFFAPWCGHCKNLEPEWAAAATAVKEQTKGKVRLGAVDATVHQVVSGRYGIRGFPTIKIFKKGEEPEDYQGGRSRGDIIERALDLFSDNAPPPELQEILSEDVLKKTCEDSQLCIIAVLPHILDTGASGRNGYLDVMLKMADKYKKKMWGWLWTEAGAQMDLEASLGIGGFGYPAMAAINTRKMKFALLRGSFSDTGIHEFLRELSVGRGSTATLGGGTMPKIHAVEPWDGKDGQLPEEEEYDLSDVELDDDFQKTEL